jgi:hypothetical protein
MLPFVAVFWASASHASPVAPETRVRVDVATDLLIRPEILGQRAIFGDSPRWGGWLRGGIWFNAESPNVCKTLSAKLGAWLGYRYEPGPSIRMFASDATEAVPGSQGIQATMLAHDLTLGLNGELTFARGCCATGFVRAHAGAGLTLTTLQIRSLDDGHVYSDTTPSLNLTGTAELGWRFVHTLEVFIGGGRLQQVGDASLQLSQSDVTLATRQTSIDGVSRSGWLFYLGMGLEF